MVESKRYQIKRNGDRGFRVIRVNLAQVIRIEPRQIEFIEDGDDTESD